MSSYSGDELVALSGATNYYTWILRHFAPHLGRRIIEVGAGVGTFSEFLLRVAAIETLILVEPADDLFPLLECRYSANTRVAVVHGSLEDVPPTSAADGIVLVNVLEHVEHPSVFLQAARTRLARNGRIFVFVPAGPRIFGTLDEAFGHHRRYTKDSLIAALTPAGFTVDVLRYVNAAGIVGWFVAGKVLRQRTLATRQVQFYDRLIIPWLSKIESLWSPPFGQSLVAVARKTGAD